MLCSEHCIDVKNKDGFVEKVWKKIFTNGRNESLDCRVYARAAAAVYGLDKFKDSHFKRLEEKLQIFEAPILEEFPANPDHSYNEKKALKKKVRKKKRRSSGFW